MASKRPSKRPPKKWWDHCVRKVKKGVRSAEKVCGALWYRKMDEQAKKRAKRRHPYGKKVGSHR